MAIARGKCSLILLLLGILMFSSTRSAQAAAQAHITISTRIRVQATPYAAISVTTATGQTVITEPFSTFQKVNEQHKVDSYIVFGVTKADWPLLCAAVARHPGSHVLIGEAETTGDRRRADVSHRDSSAIVLTGAPVTVQGLGKVSVTALPEAEQSLSQCAIVRLQMPHVSLGIAYPARLPYVRERPQEDEILILHPSVLPFLDRSTALTSVDPDMAIVLATRNQVMATPKGEMAIETLREWWIDVYTIEGKALDIAAGPHGVLLPSGRPVR